MKMSTRDNYLGVILAMLQLELFRFIRCFSQEMLIVFQNSFKV